MRYWPASFVVTDRTFSISAGLDASTLTPGSTAPDVSRATPVIDPCAYRSEGMMRSPRKANAVFSRCIRPPHVTWVYACADSNAPWDLDVGIWDLAFLVPVRGHDKGGFSENVEFAAPGGSQAAGQDPPDRASTLATNSAARYLRPSDWAPSRQAAPTTQPPSSGPTPDANGSLRNRSRR